MQKSFDGKEKSSAGLASPGYNSFSPELEPSPKVEPIDANAVKVLIGTLAKIFLFDF